MDGRRTLADRFRETTDKLKSFSVSDPLEKKFWDIVLRATSEMWINPDWSLNMELVDAVNAQSGPQTNERVFRCLKRRLSTKNGKVQLLTLTLLETLVKNCGATFQSDLAQSDLWTDVATLADPRRKGDMQVVDKVLLIVEDYARTLRPQRYQKTYSDLRAQGVRFPDRNPDEVGAGLVAPMPDSADASPELPGVSEADNAAIQAALRDLEAEERAVTPAQNIQAAGRPTQRTGLLSGGPPTGPQAQSNSIISDLSVVRNSVEVLEEALQSIPSNKPEDVVQDFIKELADQCGQMRPRLSHVIHETTLNEEAMGQALTLYEALDSTMNRYDALLARVAQGPLPAQLGEALAPQNVNAPGEADLLGDLDIEDARATLISNRNEMSSSKPAQTAPTDLFGGLVSEPPPAADGFAELAASASMGPDGFDALVQSSGHQQSSMVNQGAATLPVSTQSRDGFDMLVESRVPQGSSRPQNTPPILSPPPATSTPTNSAEQVGDLISF